MEDLKKRKLNEFDNFQISEQNLRSLLDPLAKSQLIDLLAKLGSKFSPVAGEIVNLASADPVHRKLFVRGLGWNTTSETLCAAFEVHGEIEEGAVICDKITGKSRGYGFITYKNMESAQDALSASNKLIDGHLAVCNLACEGLSSANVTPDQAQRKLYIGGLSPEITNEMLLSFFGRHGEIDEGSVAYDKDSKKSRCFGFVTYKTVEAAKKALDDSDRSLGGRNITVKYADIKGKATPTQLPPTGAPMAMLPPMAGGFPQPVKAQGPPGPPGPVTPPSYGYPQPLSYSSYPSATYPSPPVPSAAPVPTLTPTSAPPPPPASFNPYTQFPYAPPSIHPMNNSFATPPPMPVGIPGYPYYSTQ